MFNVGDEVEVTSPESSLPGALFPAKIVGRTEKSNTFVVEYKTLKADNEEEEFTEEIDVKLLRPLPPAQPREFKCGDVVEAFFTGAWWKGTITEVDNSRLWVYFRFAKQLYDFLPSELRLHREWVHGAWLPPLINAQDQHGDVSIKVEANSSKGRIEEKFSKGTLVEVTFDEEGFRGAWFAATIINAIGQDKYLIECKSLRTDDDTKFLREKVDIQHIRPWPPEAIIVDGFNLNEEVDAFYNDAWWEGIISKILEGSRYKVYFKGTRDEGEFQHSDLRPHQDWKDGTWVMASEVLF